MKRLLLFAAFLVAGFALSMMALGQNYYYNPCENVGKVYDPNRPDITLEAEAYNAAVGSGNMGNPYTAWEEVRKRVAQIPQAIYYKCEHNLESVYIFIPDGMEKTFEVWVTDNKGNSSKHVKKSKPNRFDAAITAGINNENDIYCGFNGGEVINFIIANRQYAVRIPDNNVEYVCLLNKALHFLNCDLIEEDFICYNCGKSGCNGGCGETKVTCSSCGGTGFQSFHSMTTSASSTCNKVCSDCHQSVPCHYYHAKCNICQGTGKQRK